MGLVFGQPTAPNLPPQTWAGLAMTWTGWDGSVWSLTDDSSCTVMLPGVRGFNMPPIIHYASAHASVPGVRWRGHTVDTREVFWPLQVYSDTGSAEFLARDRAFWKTMRPEKTGVWSVIQPTGDERKLRLRFRDDGTQTYSTDPSQSGWVNYGITLEAAQPYWEGKTEVGVWTTGTALPFFPTLTLSPGGTLDTAVINNPGDVEVWPIWRIYGPSTSVVVGINGRTITVPFTIPSGQFLEIDTSPRAQTAMLNGVDRTADLGGIDFAPAPADMSSSLSLSMTGTGVITAAVTPLYYRAW
jgi:hypothetical protein